MGRLLTVRSLQIWLFLSCLLFIYPTLAKDDKTSSDDISVVIQAPVPEKPYTVLFGVYPVLLTNFDMPKATFDISFYAWWRTADKNYNPSKSVEITNAAEYYSKRVVTGRNEDEFYTYLHYYATIHKYWDTKYFPFDRQLLEVEMEDYASIKYIIFEPDYEQSHLHSRLHITGWKILGLTLKKGVTHYDTNFGDISTPKGLFSRLSFTIEIKREGWRPYFNYFIGFFISAFLAAMAHFVDINTVDARANFYVGAIFAWVGNKYILDQLLPFSTEFSLYDAIQIATLIMITISIWDLIFFDLLFAGNDEKRKRYNYCGGVISFIIYIIFVTIFTYIAVIS